jgi:hypothetical protein
VNVHVTGSSKMVLMKSSMLMEVFCTVAVRRDDTTSRLVFCASLNFLENFLGLSHAQVHTRKLLLEYHTIIPSY